MPEPSTGPGTDGGRPRLLAVAGGSCSGKTTLADLVIAALGPERSTIVRTDNYYRADLLSVAAGGPVNFDVPTAIDFPLLHANLLRLRNGEPVGGPQWDFVTHSRRAELIRYEPRAVIVVEGIFALHDPDLADLYDHSCFIECPEALRLQRRLVRDIAERGRTEAAVREQFAAQVAPMHDEHVEPTKRSARRVVTQEEYCASPVAVVEELLASVTTLRSPL